MLCTCSGEQFKFEDTAPRSPESLATRDFSASGLSSSRTAEWESKYEDAQVDEAESTLKEALSLNYEEARALLGRLEYQRGSFDAALQVYQGIDIRTLSPRMSKAIMERTQQRKPRTKGMNVLQGVMSLHSVSLLLEAILLKSKSLKELGRIKEAARECNTILNIVESALPNGISEIILEDCKLQEIFHLALDLLPKLWVQAGYLDEAIVAYRRALMKPWNMDPQMLASAQKALAEMLLYGGLEVLLPPPFKLLWGPTIPKTNAEEAILLLFILVKKMLDGDIEWDQEVMDHLTFALSVSGQFLPLAEHVEQVLPGTYSRAERWFFLSLCYSAAGQNGTALNILNKVSGSSEANNKPNILPFLLGAKLCSQNPKQAEEGIKFARRVMEIEAHQNKHFTDQAHKYMGVCYGNSARVSLSDSERVRFHRESLNSLNQAVSVVKDDSDLIFSLGLENAVQRNLGAAFDNAMLYSEMTAGSSGRGWKLLAQVVSAEQRLKDAETIVDLALDETVRMDQLELLRLKAVLQIAQERPKHAIETYRVLLGLIQSQRDQSRNIDPEQLQEKRLEVEAWQDLAKIYTKLESWLDAEVCLSKAKSIELYSPRSWHATGQFLQAQSLYNEALVAYTMSLSIEPDYVPAIVSTAEVLMKMGKKSLPLARSFLMSALRLEPTNHEAWWNLGLISKTEGSLQQAVDCFQAAHELKMSASVDGSFL